MYQVSIVPLEERIAYIASREPTGAKEPVQFQGEQRQLDRYRVESKFLTYRLANMRTSVKQAEYISNHHLDPNFFHSAEENVTAQQYQHAILLELSKVSNADIYSHLRDHPSQDRPIVITSAGSVVDGNRRLAAMRELHSIEPPRYSSFLYVDVAVLPSTASENDLVELETIIQIRPDLRSAYGWIEEALGLERQMQVLDWPIEKVSQLWNQPPEALLKRLETLEIAREYLAQIGKPDEFGEVADSEQAITTFRDTTSTDSFKALAPRRKQANRLVMFSVLKSTDISRRKYDYAKNIDEITGRVMASFDVSLSPVIDIAPDPDNPLGGLPSDATDVDQAFIDLLKDPENADDIASYAEEALIEYDLQKKAQKKGNQLLLAVSSAHAKLMEVQRANLQPETYLPSAVKLLNVIAVATDLLRFLESEDSTLVHRLDPAEINQLKTAVTLLQSLNAKKGG